jgi:hypothetical protein
MIEGEALDRVASVTRPFPVVRTICSALFTERGLAAIKRVSARFPGLSRSKPLFTFVPARNPLLCRRRHGFVELLQDGVQEIRVVLVGHEGFTCCCVW